MAQLKQPTQRVTVMVAPKQQEVKTNNINNILTTILSAALKWVFDHVHAIFTTDATKVPKDIKVVDEKDVKVLNFPIWTGFYINVLGKNYGLVWKWY